MAGAAPALTHRAPVQEALGCAHAGRRRIVTASAPPGGALPLRCGRLPGPAGGRRTFTFLVGPASCAAASGPPGPTPGPADPRIRWPHQGPGQRGRCRRRTLDLRGSRARTSLAGTGHDPAPPLQWGCKPPRPSPSPRRRAGVSAPVPPAAPARRPCPGHGVGRAARSGRPPSVRDGAPAVAAGRVPRPAARSGRSPRRTRRADPAAGRERRDVAGGPTPARIQGGALA